MRRLGNYHQLIIFSEEISIERGCQKRFEFLMKQIAIYRQPTFNRNSLRIISEEKSASNKLQSINTERNANLSNDLAETSNTSFV